MTRPSALSAPWPDGRALAGLWQQLQSRQPSAFWLGYLTLHHVEAPVLVRNSTRLDPLSAGMLRYLSAAAPIASRELAGSLGLGPAIAQRLLAELAGAGLIAATDEGLWRATPAGDQLLAADSQPDLVERRQVFHFIDGGPGAPPRFLAVKHCDALPFPPDVGWSFAVARLKECIARPPEWKVRHHFPDDVVDLVPYAGESPARVVLDRAEQLPVALILTAGRGESVTCSGFAVERESWSLVRLAPVFQFTYPLPATEVLGKLLDDPNLDSWRAAWRAWGKARGLPAPEVEACRLARGGPHLHVTAPPVLIDRLGAMPTGETEAWILAGTGAVRCAAMLSFRAEPSIPVPRGAGRGPRH